MVAPEPTSQPCYSVRLVRPFLTVLKSYPGFPAEVLAPLEEMDPDERLPIAACNELIGGGVALTGDPDIGLRAAMAIEVGDHGALEYAARSAPTVADAIVVVGRFTRLLNDALEFRVDREGDKAVVRLESSIVLPRACADFQSASLMVAVRQTLGSYHPMDVQVLLPHARPAKTDVYDEVLRGCTVVFGAPFTGFIFDAAKLQLPLPTADHKLHALLARHAELLLTELPKAQSMTEQVRAKIAQELSGGNPTVEHIARQLHVSTRTLGRKLAHEGTSFKDLLDDLRRRMAQRYVGGHDLGLSEIAFLLGFSQTPVFHRAFKRWTGQTPGDYRRERRG